jgi:hypothetical protein
MLACVDTTLATSAIVERLGGRRVKHPGSRYVVLRNPPGPRANGVLFAVEPERGTPRQFVVEYVWPGVWQGTNGMQPPPDPKVSEIEGEMLTDVATRLLQLVRASCAPDAYGEPVCTRVANGHGGRCVLGT